MSVTPGSDSPAARLLQDPRSVITPDAFRIDPELLGTPLARPWRRAMAMAVDGVLVAILANAPSVLFALAGAFVLFRASAKPARQGYLRTSVRLMLRFWGAVALFVVVLMTWSRVTDLGESWFSDEPAAGPADAAEVDAPAPPQLSGVAGVRVAADAIQLARARNEAEAHARVRGMVESMRSRGVGEDDIRDVLEGLSGIEDRPWVGAVADSALRSLSPGASAEAGAGAGADSPDSVAVRLAAALEAGDSTGAAELRARLGVLLAADTLGELREELTASRQRSRELERELREERSGSGILATLRSLADDLGLGFGWTGLYFTSFLALWNGYTPGKRLLGIRVIRLDGRPLGWWMSFERFGGYAASLATGLLGFIQILWDRNRQGIHDKIAETVVVYR